MHSKGEKAQLYWLGSWQKRGCNSCFSSKLLLQNRGLLNCQPGRTRLNNNRHFKILIIPLSSCPTLACVMSCTPSNSTPHFHCWTDCRIISSNLILRKSSAQTPDEKLLRIYLLSQALRTAFLLCLCYHISLSILFSTLVKQTVLMFIALS